MTRTEQSIYRIQEECYHNSFKSESSDIIISYIKEGASFLMITYKKYTIYSHFENGSSGVCNAKFIRPIDNNYLFEHSLEDALLKIEAIRLFT
jgi:hypothetical protein